MRALQIAASLGALLVGMLPGPGQSPVAPKPKFHKKSRRRSNKPTHKTASPERARKRAACHERYVRMIQREREIGVDPKYRHGPRADTAERLAWAKAAAGWSARAGKAK